MLPIPGTSSVAHPEKNTAAARINLTEREVNALTKVTGRDDAS
jgi:aryl-alcohol dehydrogenase-like predicted oxidoreductase